MALIGMILFYALQFYIWIIILQVVISWLVIFDVINMRNRKAQNLMGLLYRLTDPVFKPIQRVVPPLAGIDITPILVIFGIILIQNVVLRIFV